MSDHPACITLDPTPPQRGPAVALAPQDRTGRGDLSRDSAAWTWVMVDASQDESGWWEGSDYTDPASRPAFIDITKR